MAVRLVGACFMCYVGGMAMLLTDPPQADIGIGLACALLVACEIAAYHDARRLVR